MPVPEHEAEGECLREQFGRSNNGDVQSLNNNQMEIPAMLLIKRLTVLTLTGLLVFLMGCGDDGPLGNNAPQGRPEWMKKKSDNPQPSEAPQKQ